PRTFSPVFSSSKPSRKAQRAAGCHSPRARCSLWARVHAEPLSVDRPVRYAATARRSRSSVESGDSRSMPERSENASSHARRANDSRARESSFGAFDDMLQTTTGKRYGERGKNCHDVSSCFKLFQRDDLEDLAAWGWDEGWARTLREENRD